MMNREFKKLASDVQMSEAFITSMFLALSGGFQDAYTYFTRDEVFSNAQTGNVVLMSTHLMMGEWMQGIKYLFPLLAFAGGVFFAERLQAKYKYAKKLHWRQGILLLEMLILFVVGFIPKEANMVATVLVSFSCAMQVQTFRKVKGYSFASTMCIGNLRSGMESLCAYWKTQNRTNLQKSFCYWGIILMFAIGAALGVFCVAAFGARAIWISCLLLSVSFLFMFAKEDMEELKEEIEEIEEKKLF